MPKLERAYQPVFGSQGNNDEFAVFGSMKSGTPIYSKTLSTLFQSPAFLQGWQDAVAADKAPFLEEMNALFLSVFQQLAYQFQSGMPEWDANTTYYANSFCQVDGIIYKSLTDENTGNNPANDTTNWEAFKSGGGSGLKIGTMFFSQGYIDTSKGLEIEANGQVVQASSLPAGFVSWVDTSDSLDTDFSTTEQNWQAEAALNPEGICGKYVVNRENGNITSIRFPKYPDWAVQSYDFTANGGTVPVIGNGQALSLETYNTNASAGATNTVVRGALVQFYNNSWAGGNTGTYIRPDGLGQSVNQPSFASNAAYLHGANNQATLLGVSREPSNSGLVAQLGSISSSSTKIKGKWYIQIATGQETEVIVKNQQELLSGRTLFEPKYSDTPLYDIGWALANSTVSKAVYPNAYEALLVELNPDVAVGTTVDITDNFSYTKRGLDVKETGDSTITDYSWIVDKAGESFTCPKKARVGAVNAQGTVPVVGNGTALQFYNGAQTFGTANSTNGFVARMDAAGKPVGATVTNNSGVSTNTAIGLAPSGDTGLVADLGSVASELSLYFCIATVGQNAAIANLGRMSEEISNKADKSEIDGKWTDEELVIFEGTTKGEYAVDLSEYLPEDNHEYKLFLQIIIIAKAAGCGISLYSTVFHGGETPDFSIGRTQVADVANNIVTPFVIGADKTLHIELKENFTLTKIISHAYRRIGKNNQQNRRGK